jgi:hypothetical protein
MVDAFSNALTGRSGRSDGAARHARASRVLTVIFTTAVIVSVIHYTDNYVNFNDYPQPDQVDLPAAGIWSAWIAFTAVGLAGYLLFLRSPSVLALALLAIYSGSGLVGILHYSVDGAFQMPWWRQAHVCADILCGFAMITFVFWARTYLRDLISPAAGRRGPLSHEMKEVHE